MSLFLHSWTIFFTEYRILVDSALLSIFEKCYGNSLQSPWFHMKNLLLFKLLFYIICPFSLADFTFFPLCRIPGWGRSSGEGNGNTLQYSCLKKSMDSGAWWATVHGVTKRHDWGDLREKHLFLLYRLCQGLWLCGSQQTVANASRHGNTDHPTCLLRNLYIGQEATVRTGHGTTDWL